MNLNQDKIASWFQEYIKHIDNISIENHVSQEEGYKFASVDNFNTHFDIDALDLSSMLEKSILNNNLVSSAHFLPRNMLLIYARDNPEETREILRNLFDETKDVYSRITDSIEAFSILNETRNAKIDEKANTYIGLRFISLLLSFRFPDKYNALKPAEWKFFARYINPEFSIPKHTSAGEQYKLYELYIELLREYLKTRTEIEPIRKALTKNLTFEDRSLRWITQDVIYVTSKLLSKKNSKQEENIVVQQPSNEDIESEIITDLEEDTGFMPLEKYLEDYILKNWNIIDFGEKLSIYQDDDGPAQQYTTEVGIIDILAKDADGNFVVIELKRAESKYHVLGQVLNYMTWVRENLATNNEGVRGMIIVGRADKTLKSAVKEVQGKVTLKEYRMRMTLINS